MLYYIKGAQMLSGRFGSDRSLARYMTLWVVPLSNALCTGSTIEDRNMSGHV